MKPAFLLVLLALGLLSAIPAFAAGPNLCHEQEDTIFACQLQNKKFVAVCALDDPDIKKGYPSLVYRFGTPDHIKLSLPEHPDQFRRFTFTDETTNYEPIEDDQYLRFVYGPFNYTVYTAVGEGFDLEGLAVFRDGQLLNKMSCAHDTLEINMAINSLQALGVQYETDDKQTFRFWSQLLPRKSAVLARKPFGDPKYQLPPAHPHKGVSKSRMANKPLR